MEHGRARVGFEDYAPVLETTLRLLPPGCQVRLLADRGFEHAALIRWLQAHQWSWTIRAKSDLNITCSKGETAAVASVHTVLEWIFQSFSPPPFLKRHLLLLQLPPRR
ncbi:MAG: transposase [Leptolyngbyaceae cyanobacterium CSU_1_4]|nr:transposase [Leptolyngbyaceae cyanobacterium CSU_1_4]